jgi:hypothetical protein
MDFPARGQEIIDALYAQHVALATGSDDEQRLLTRLIAEQLAFELGPRWGVKAASPTRPQGSSEIAFNGPPLYIWRWSDGDGHVTGLAGSPLHPPLLMPLDQTVNQFFIAVDPIDHLRVSDTRPPPRSDPPPDPPPATVDLTPILARLDRLEQLIQPIADEWTALQQDVRTLDGRIDQRYVYVGPWGVKLVSVPESQVPKAVVPK